MQDILIVIDMQNDFINGSLGTKEAEDIVDNVKNKIQSYLDANKKVFFTRDTHYTYYLETFEGKNLPVPHCIENTEGWQISKELPFNDEQCFIQNKNTFGYLNWKNILPCNSGIEICGLCTDICVISNALILRALYPNTIITVDSKCCAGVTPELHNAALEIMKSNQIEVV